MKPGALTIAVVACLGLGSGLAGCPQEEPAAAVDAATEGPGLPDRGPPDRAAAGDRAASDARPDAAPAPDAAASPDLRDGATVAADRAAEAAPDAPIADAADGDALAADGGCGPYPHWNLHLGQCLPSCGRVMGDAALAKEGTEASYLAYGTCLMAHPSDPCDPARGHYLAQTWDCGTACCIYPDGDGGQSP